MTKFTSAAEAVRVIETGQTVASAGVIGWSVPDALLEAIAIRFDADASPANLAFYFPCGTGDAMGIRGMDHVARKGLMKRIISGSYINPVNPETGERPALMRLIHANEVEAYAWPIGASMHWLREVARGAPGYMTRIGIGTFADPQQQGGKITERAQDDLIRKITFDGEQYLFYPSFPVNVALICATSADDDGNLSWEDEPLTSANVALALAAKASGGKVIAQVRRRVAKGVRPATAVGLPGIFIDQVVLVEDMLMTTGTVYDPAYTGREPRSFDTLAPMPFSPARIVAQRAAQEVGKRELSIFGFGAAADIPRAMVEQGLITNENCADYWFTTEHGSYGGLVMNGWTFSANLNPESILDGLSQFDVINGGLCRFAALAFAEFDASGAVNVSRFGSANPGSGGFIDIAANAQRLILTGTFTTGGLKVACNDGKLGILAEGRVSKFVRKAEQITYPAAVGVHQSGQVVKIITERAVFEYGQDGLTLVEIAPGIDLERQVLALMEFAPDRILEPLPVMDAGLFKE